VDTSLIFVYLSYKRKISIRCFVIFIYGFFEHNCLRIIHCTQITAFTCHLPNGYVQTDLINMFQLLKRAGLRLYLCCAELIDHEQFFQGW